MKSEMSSLQVGFAFLNVNSLDGYLIHSRTVHVSEDGRDMVILREADVTFLQDWERICRGEVSVSDIAVVFTHQHTEFIYVAFNHGRIAIAHVSPHEFSKALSSYITNLLSRQTACVSLPQMRRTMDYLPMRIMTKAAHRPRNDLFRACPYVLLNLWRATRSCPPSAAYK